MNEDQKEAIANLAIALIMATHHEVLDELAKLIHPDTINTFCDAVDEIDRRENQITERKVAL